MFIKISLTTQLFKNNDLLILSNVKHEYENTLI